MPGRSPRSQANSNSSRPPPSRLQSKKAIGCHPLPLASLTRLLVKPISVPMVNSSATARTGRYWVPDMQVPPWYGYATMETFFLKSILMAR